jgi:hypothetical protein
VDAALTLNDKPKSKLDSHRSPLLLNQGFHSFLCHTLMRESTEWVPEDTPFGDSSRTRTFRCTFYEYLFCRLSGRNKNVGEQGNGAALLLQMSGVFFMMMMDIRREERHSRRTSRNKVSSTKQEGQGIRRKGF